MKCGHCGENMVFTQNQYGDFWECKQCDVRKYGNRTEADKELRLLRMKAHEVFDLWWQTKNYTRFDAYRILAKRFALPIGSAHIGHFGKKTMSKNNK